MRQELLQSLPETIEVEGNYSEREVYVDGAWLNPKHSQLISNHSPDGFNWGYGGSGPAQFSLSLLLLFLPINEATEYYQEFKFKVIASLPRVDFKETVRLRDELTKIVNERKAN